MEGRGGQRKPRRGFRGRGGSCGRRGGYGQGSGAQSVHAGQPGFYGAGIAQGASGGSYVPESSARAGPQRGARGSKGGGRGGRRKDDKQIHLGFKALQAALLKEPDEIALDFGSNRCEDAFEQLLERREMNSEMIGLFIQVLAKVCVCHSQGYLVKILSSLKESMFLLKHVKAYLCKMHMVPNASEDYATLIENVATIFRTLIRKFPDISASLPITDLTVAVTRLRENGVELSDKLVEKVENLTEIQEETVVETERQEQHDKTGYKREATDSEGPPPNNFRDIPVVPVHEDIHGEDEDKGPYLRKNKVTGAYENLDHYLDVQFRLLREDFIQPLREGIHELIKLKGRADLIRKLSDIRVYSAVHILYPECTQQGLVFRLKFDNTNLKKYRWETGKRLIFGSLLCLSKDMFQTFRFATVVNRDLKELQKGIISVKFVESIQNGGKATQQEDVYEMVETTAYFEAYRHVLTALQETHEEDLPFQPYLIQCNRNIRAPRYLQRRWNEDAAIFDFTPILRETSVDEVRQESLLKRLSKRSTMAVDAKKVHVLDTYSWPSAEDLGLDDSQLESLKIGLTKELAVIQGPPGTGKTFMALKIAKLFLHNKDAWLRDVVSVGVTAKKTKPILVICYTNHALDQFLEGILTFHSEGIVRIGGRSSSEALKSLNISAAKEKMRRNRKVPRGLHRGYYEVRSSLEDVTRRMQQSTLSLKKCRENILTENTLLHHGIIEQKEYDSLMKPFTENREIVQGCVMVEWLGLTTAKAKPEQPEAAQSEATAEPVELLENCPVTFDGNMVHRCKNTQVQFGGSDFSIVANLMTGIGGTIVSKARPTGGWKVNCKSLYVDQEGLVKLSVGGVGFIQSRTKINDGQQHEVAVTYMADEQRVLLYIDGEVEEDGQFELMEDNTVDILKIGFTCDKYPLQQGHFSGTIYSLVYYPNSSYNDLVTGEGAIVENEAAALEDQRMVYGDDDDILGEIQARLRRETPTHTSIQVVDFTKEHVVKDSAGGWQVQNPKKMKKRIERTLKVELSKTDVMSDGEAARVRDFWTLSPSDRWRLYRKWANEIVAFHEENVTRIQAEYEECVQKLQDVRNLQSFEVLRDSQVIGMTTTGAAKYRDILQQVRPRITIVEEAAEVLESHIVTALTPACEHLILIGDHKQLRPNPTVYDLAKSYKLDVSLFERLVHNELPFACLEAQHRMRPEISRMMKHIYPNLKDHDSVQQLPNVKGVGKNIFFIQHHVDEVSVQDIKSHSNEHEAKFTVGLCRYFLQQGYTASQITILTPYVGQLMAFKKHMMTGSFKGVRVCTVDNFQGEENDIILMSLVRSNKNNKIGFLSTDNRICVALSRAKQGFYCVGNIALFESKNDLWRKIIGEMRESGNVGESLDLLCQNHPGTAIKVSRKEDFSKVPNGGCMRQCEFRLACGHVCEQLCHPNDPNHVVYKCRKPCEKPLCKDGHKCKKICFKECGPCRELVRKFIPSCGHVGLVPCHLDPDEFTCQEKCEKSLSPCGHRCSRKCGEPCTDQCMVAVEKEWPRCAHYNTTQCYVDVKNTPCPNPCEAELLCGHKCYGTCAQCQQGRFHVPCKERCGRVLFCDHECSEPCTVNCPPCSQECANRCQHSRCKKKCGEPCPPCLEPCKWQCPHARCTKRCGELCDRLRCNQPCRKQIKKCKHPCIGLCGEPCPQKCRICDKEEVTEVVFGTEDEEDARFIQLSDCPHVIEVSAMDHFMELEVEKRKEGKAGDVKMVKCPLCNTVIRTSLRYGNIIKKVLGDFEMIKIKLAQQDDQVVLAAQTTLLEVTKIRTHFPDMVSKLTFVLQSDYLSRYALNLAQNQTRFLQFLLKLKEIVGQLKRDIPKYTDKRIETMVVVNELQAEVRLLQEWIGRPRQRFGDQELEDFNQELLRCMLLFTHKAIETQLINREACLNDIEVRSMRRIQRVLEKGQRLDPVKRDTYTTFLHDISAIHCADVRYQKISDDEKNMIVKAMGLKQGHWFKCPKGHVYCIDQCGGATEEGNCPECGSMIGGRNHTLRHDNRLAGEMDGARHAAWSQHGNDMHNFDFEF